MRCRRVPRQGRHLWFCHLTRRKQSRISLSPRHTTVGAIRDMNRLWAKVITPSCGVGVSTFGFDCTILQNLQTTPVRFRAARHSFLSFLETVEDRSASAALSWIGAVSKLATFFCVVSYMHRQASYVAARGLVNRGHRISSCPFMALFSIDRLYTLSVLRVMVVMLEFVHIPLYVFTLERKIQSSDA